jgi:GLPGLI family protein
MKHLLLLLSTISFAQQSVRVTYESKKTMSAEVIAQLPADTRDDIVKHFTSPVILELTHNGERSIVKNETSKAVNIPSNTTDTSTKQNLGTIVKASNSRVFKDFLNNCTYSLYVIKDSEYYIKELPKEKNKLIFDQKVMMIDGYNCKSAMEVTALNDTIQYWYTQDIPIFDGPKQMTNIPGLILRYQLKSHTITATKIEFFDKKLVIEGMNKRIPIISLDEYNILSAKSKEPTTTDDGRGIKTTTETTTIKF